MCFEVFDGYNGAVGFYPSIWAIFFAGIDDKDTFATESAIGFEGKAVGEFIPIKILELFSITDFSNKR